MARITLVNRSRERGEPLAQLLNDRVGVATEFVPWDGDFQVPADADLLVNATSIGLSDADARVPVDVSSLRDGLVVADVIFNPPRTRLIRDAEANGAITLDGLGMLVNQGVIGFKIWTGVDPDPQAMRAALEEYLGL